MKESSSSDLIYLKICIRICLQTDNDIIDRKRMLYFIKLYNIFVKHTYFYPFCQYLEKMTMMMYLYCKETPQYGLRKPYYFFSFSLGAKEVERYL